MMFVLVYWIDEKLFSVVEADDVVLDKFNSVLKVDITCLVKWRERRSRKKVEERLYDAQIKAISGTLHPFFFLIQHQFSNGFSSRHCDLEVH